MASDLEAAEKRIIALREDAAVVKPEWVGNLVFSRAKYLSPGVLVCYLLFSCCIFLRICMYVCIGGGPVGQFSVVSSTQKDDVTITIIKNEVEKRFVRIETRKGGHGDGKEGTQGYSRSVYVYMYAY